MNRRPRVLGWNDAFVYLMKVWDVRSIRSQLLYWPRLPGNGVTGRPSGFGAVVRAPGVAAPVTCITLDAKPPYGGTP